MTDKIRSYDLVVIGSGPGGHHAAIQGAKLGKSVLVVEARSRVGGAGLTTGTVPSKALRELALRARGQMINDWAAAAQGVMARCREIVARDGFAGPHQVELHEAIGRARPERDVAHGASKAAENLDGFVVAVGIGVGGESGQVDERERPVDAGSSTSKKCNIGHS